MADKPLLKVEIKDHAGLVSNASPHRIGAGAQVQENISTVTPGQLTVRRGMRPATVLDGGSADTQDAIFAASLLRRDATYFLYETTATAYSASVHAANDGEVRLLRDPA